MEAVPNQKEVIQAKFEELKRRQYSLVFGVEGESQTDLIDAITQYAFLLQEKYNDPYSFVAYHALIGSTPSDDVPLMDFPGDDSVEGFIAELEQKYAVENK